MTVILPMLLICIVSGAIGGFIGIICKKKGYSEKINKHSSIIVTVFIALCCIAVMIVIFVYVEEHNAPDVVGKTYWLNDENNISNIYFKSKDIVIVENIDKKSYEISRVSLSYKFIKGHLIITTEHGFDKIYDYDKENDCFIYSVNVKYCGK